MVHRDIGRKQLDRVVELIGAIAAVEIPPRMEGRFLSMILAPNREAIEREKKAERKAAQDEAPDTTEATDEAQTAAAEEQGA
jgi:translation initiation factor IF-3